MRRTFSAPESFCRRLQNSCDDVSVMSRRKALLRDKPQAKALQARSMAAAFSFLFGENNDLCVHGEFLNRGWESCAFEAPISQNALTFGE